MADPNDLLQQAQDAETADKNTATQIVGESAVTNEQAGYASTIAANNAAKPPIAPPVPVTTGAGDVLDDVEHRVAQVPQAVYHGAVHAVGEFANSLMSLATINTPQMIYEAFHPQAKIDNAATLQSVKQSVRAGADAITPTMDTGLGDAISGTTQFLASFLPIARAAKVAEGAGAVARIASNSAAAGASQAAAFDPSGPRFSDLVESFPALKNPLTGYLKSQPGDTAADGALKNFLEGTGGGIIGDTLIEGAMAVFKGARSALSMAKSTGDSVNVKPSTVSHPEPQPEPTPATLDESSHGVDVHSEEMTDEQWQQFQGLRSHVQADPQLGVDSKGLSEESVHSGSGSDRAEAPHPEEGKPLTVYRGANSPLEDSHFERNSLGYATGRPSSGLGVFFTNNAETAARHGDVTQHVLDIQNPKVYKAEDVPSLPDRDAYYAHQQELRRQGYDGVTIDASHLGGDVNHVAFEPAQVRDAQTGTRSAPVEAPPKPYEPPTVDTAKPDPTAPVQPTDATAGAPKVFDPAGVTKNAISISPEKAEAFNEALRQGWYNKIPGVLDDTHRTIPWDQLSDGANLQGLMNAMTDHFGDAMRAASGPSYVSDKAVQQLAKDLGGNVDVLRQTYQNVTDNGGLAAQVTAGYNMMMASARQLEDLGQIARKLVPTEPEGQAAILAFQKQLEIHAAITGMVRQNSGEIGRALAAHRTLKASSDVALSNISELAGTVLGPEAINKFLKNANGDLASLNAAADAARGNNFFGVIKEIAQNGMLSGFPTQIANLAGNASNMMIKTAERYLAGVIGNVRGVLMPDAEIATIRAAVAHTTATVSAVRDSFPLMVKALSTEQALSASGRPVARAIYKDPTGLTGPELTLAKVINITGQVVRYPGRLMGAIDNLNMGVGRQQDLAARIYTQTAGEADAKGLVGDARDAFIDSRQAELRADPPSSLTDKSTEAGLYQSFQESARTRFGEGISSMLNSHPVVKLIVAPFVHRPLNMLRQSLMDYTALGTLSSTMRDTLRAGNSDTDLALARMSIGTSAIVGSYELAANGQIKGMGLGNRNTQSLDGIPNDTVKIGGKWWSFSRLDPIGLWMGIGADLHEAINRYHNPNDPQGQADLATMSRMAIQVVGMGAMDKSFMKSIDQITQAMGSKDPVQAEKLMQNVIASNTAKLVPFSGALRGVAQATDTTRRAVGGDGLDNIWDAVKKGIPTLSKDLPPQRDVLGREMQIPAGASAWWNPFAGATASTDHMDQELSKVAVSIKTPPRQIDNTVLDAHQYDEVLRNATQTKLFAGHSMNLAEYMAEVTKSSTWMKYENTDDHGVQARTKITQGIIDAAYKYGSDKFVHDHADFRQLQKQQAINMANHFKPVNGVPTPVQ